MISSADVKMLHFFKFPFHFFRGDNTVLMIGTKTTWLGLKKKITFRLEILNSVVTKLSQRLVEIFSGFTLTNVEMMRSLVETIQ